METSNQLELPINGLNGIVIFIHLPNRGASYIEHTDQLALPRTSIRNVPLRWGSSCWSMIHSLPGSTISFDSISSLVYVPFIKLTCCTCYHSWSCNKPVCENLHLDINPVISWHFWCARCPALRTNVPLWRCGWATCAVLSDFLRVL